MESIFRSRVEYQNETRPLSTPYRKGRTKERRLTIVVTETEVKKVSKIKRKEKKKNVKNKIL